jgi:hypothetical protein
MDRDLYAVAKQYVSSMAPTEKHPPGYYLMSAPWGGFVPATSSLAEFAENRLRSENLAKLRMQLNRNLITADERHAFLIVGLTDLTHIPLTSEADGELPEGAPGTADLTSCSMGLVKVLAWTP